jgi:2-C-methyl-D-erythritol 4-phosphate cytidylyltransferase
MFFKRRQPPVYTAAVITAAGHSSRMQGIDKVFAPLGGVPVLVHSLMAFERCARIHEIVAVVREECIPEVLELSREFGVTKLRSIVKGGPSRQQSVYAGVLACSEEARLICIHDGARPLVDERVICGALDAAERFDAATACVALKETVKFSRGGFCAGTPDRSAMVAVQTPQVFSRELYLAAYRAAKKEYSDDCQLVEAMGHRVALSDGDYANIKLTTPEDLVMAQSLLDWREQA